MRQETERLSPEDNRRAWRYAVLIVAVLIAIAGLLFLLPHLPARTDVRSLQAERAALTAQAAEGLDVINVSLVFSPEEEAQLNANQILRLTNRTGQAQQAVVLRSWTGAYLWEDTSPAASDELYDACYPKGFEPGGLVMDNAHVNGVITAMLWQDEAHTVLTLPLTEAWQPGETLTIELAWHATVPECRSRFGRVDQTYALGNLFPVPAVWEDGQYRTEPYIAVGDPFRSDCANWRVTITLPKGYNVAATGEMATLMKDNTQHTLTCGVDAVRDFALVIRRNASTTTVMENGVKIIAQASYKAYAKQLASFAARALRSYEAHWGPYAYPTLTVCEVDFPYGGMEYPGLVMLSAASVAAGGDALEPAVAHEVAHQWWGMQVGSDSWYQPWQDESLCEYAMLTYIGDYYGAASKEKASFAVIDTAMQITVPGGLTPATPIDYYTSLNDYGIVAYDRGAALWQAMEKLLGQDGLHEALRDYQAQYRFKHATRADLTALLSRHAGMDVTALMTDYLDTVMN